MTGSALARSSLAPRRANTVRTPVRNWAVMSATACAVALTAVHLLCGGEAPAIRVVDAWTAPDGKHLLSVSGLHSYRSGRMLIVTGVATNRARVPLSNAALSALCLDRNGVAVDTQSTMLARRLLPQGESSGFKVIMSDGGRGTTVELAFGPLTGDRVSPLP